MGGNGEGRLHTSGSLPAAPVGRPGKRIVIATIGSLGDLHPCIALALALRERGHFVAIATTGVYRTKIEALGVPFYSLRPEITPDDPEVIRRVMDMKTGPEVLFRELLLPGLREMRTCWPCPGMPIY